MAGKDQMAIFPSRANFVAIKQRIASAQRGLGLLRRKRDALELQLKSIRKELNLCRKDMQNLMHEAIFSMAIASFLNTDLKLALALKPQRADAYIRIHQTKILGFTIPKFKLIMDPPSTLPYTGLSTGGRQVVQVRKHFQDALKNLVEIASLQYSEIILSNAVLQNNMRVNGLDYIVIPRFIKTMNYILEALDELEREDFYRLKCSQGKQREKKSSGEEIVKKTMATTEDIIDERISIKRRSTYAGEVKQSLISPAFSVGEMPAFIKQSLMKTLSIPSLRSIDINENDIRPKKVIESTSDIEETSDNDNDVDSTTS